MSPRFLAIVWFAANLWPSLAIHAEDWPGWGGPAGNLAALDKRVIPVEQQFKLEVAWKVPLGSGYSCVSVSNGVAVTGFSDDAFNYLGAFDANTGARLWEYQLGPVYKGHTGSHDGPIATPLIVGDRIYILDTFGTLFAIRLQDGQELWTRDLPAEFDAYVPHYGFGSSPAYVGEVLLVQTGGPNRQSVAGFDMATGKTLWSMGSGRVEQQAPLVWDAAGQRQLLAIANNSLWGIEPLSGKQLWQYEFTGTNNPIGSPTATLTPGSGNRLLFKDSSSASRLIELSEKGGEWSIEDLWTTPHLKNTYVPSIYYDGNFFGYNTRTLCCVDEETGDLVWRSRPPGDGFPILVDGHLVIITKQGKLSIAPATSKGYEEKASMQLFDGLVWSPPSYAEGSLYLRSMTELARVDIQGSTEPSMALSKELGIIANSRFERFIASLEKSDDRKASIDDFMESQSEFPIIEDKEIVHFVYRGTADDLAISTPIIGERFDHQMNRVAGTDFYYYSARLEPDARVSYRFSKDFSQTIVDPLNESGYVEMPDFVRPNHLREPDPSRRGRLETVSFYSEELGKKIVLDVYLPHGFSSQRLYPVAYFNQSGIALRTGMIERALDNLIGESIEPVVVVFIPTLGTNPVTNYEEYAGIFKDRHSRFVLNEVIPEVEGRYSVKDSPDERAMIGSMFSAIATIHTAFNYPGYFNKIGLHNMWWDEGVAREYTPQIPNPESRSLVIYNDWATYAYRSPNEGTDVVASARRFANTLRGKGYDFTGVEHPQGDQWGDTINRLDKLFETLFPIR